MLFECNVYAEKGLRIHISAEFQYFANMSAEVVQSIDFCRISILCNDDVSGARVKNVYFCRLFIAMIFFQN